jgi:hypothetical protein
VLNMCDPTAGALFRLRGSLEVGTA